MYLFFDTETTGLPRNLKAPVTDLANWPRMVQIAWILSDEESNQIESADFIIKPDGYSIPVEASSVHGIYTARAIEEGKELFDVLSTFSELVRESEFLVAHNISFDEKIIGAELLRASIQSDFNNKKRICTMMSSTDFCQIPGRYGFKLPKLTELHMKLFGEGFDEAHDAAIDINATEKCFWEMRKLGAI